MKYLLFLTSFTMTMISGLNAQTIIPLYDKVPNSKTHSVKEVWEEGNGIRRISKVSEPVLYLYQAKETGLNQPAVIICPGGGYQILAIDHEGFEVAEALNKMGITAFVLKYRLPEDSIVADKKIAPIQDAQRAIQYVRANAAKWNLDTSKIGIMGFSAGGHLASTASTHFKKAYIDNPGGLSLRPDFSILIYPVISFQPGIGHEGSKNRLIGASAAKELVAEFSNELQVDSSTPPAFLLHAADDLVVPVTNSTLYLQALVKNKVKAELHVYQEGGHGFGLRNKTTADDWTERLKNWLKANKILP